MKVSTVEQMRLMDKTAITHFGIPEIILMENAGLAVYELIRSQFSISDLSFAVFCGAGNNGGDGLVIARKLFSNGGKVKVFQLGDPQKYAAAALENFRMLQKIHIPYQIINDETDLENELKDYHIFIDAIFGTGLVRQVSGLYARVIDRINASQKTVFSVDIPSGINGNNGAVMGIAVKADYTVTFGLPKIGNLQYPGYENCGKLFVSHISFPPELTHSAELTISVNQPMELPKRAADGHKGTFGQALFIAGARNYYGAPYYAALSFLKAGGGYSRLAAPESVIPFIAARGNEIVFLPQPQTPSGSIAASAENDLIEISEKMDIVIIGPGLSLQPETKLLVQNLVKRIQKPLLIDGDGLTAISETPGVLAERKQPTILTPHLGEMSRLTGRTSAEIREGTFSILRQTAKTLKSYLVLKGANSLIASPDGHIDINLSGNSGMGTAGSGDVLCGTIAAMYGLGLNIHESVKKGVFLHGLAGDLAAEEIGEDGMTAQDILNYLPQALKTERNGLNDKQKNLYKLDIL